MRGVQTWLNTGDLETVVLEIYDPKTDALIFRWDIDISMAGRRATEVFGPTPTNSRYAIRKAGWLQATRATASLLQTKPGRPDVSDGARQPPLDGRDDPPEPRHNDRAQRPRREHSTEEGLMLTVDEAFRKFKSRLELNDREQANASARQTEVREYLDTKFEIDRSFLTGSYARWTKTKPLKDVDIFFVLKASEDHYRSKAPSVVLTDFHDALVEKYGDKAKKQNRSINVDFGVKADAEDNTDYRVISVDVVPAFDKDDDFEIPDDEVGKWIKTNPKIHAKKATAAHQAYSSEWKGLVRMVKYWNNNPKHGEKASEAVVPARGHGASVPPRRLGRQFRSRDQGFFATLADRIFDEWPDPAGLGPAVSNGMDCTQDSGTRPLRAAEREATLAIDHVRRGRNGEALKRGASCSAPNFHCPDGRQPTPVEALRCQNGPCLSFSPPARRYSAASGYRAEDVRPSRHEG